MFPYNRHSFFINNSVYKNLFFNETFIKFIIYNSTKMGSLQTTQQINYKSNDINYSKIITMKNEL